MSVGNLESALANLDLEIERLTASIADPDSYSIEGLSVAKQKLPVLLDSRAKLAKLIADTGGRLFQVHSRWVP